MKWAKLLRVFAGRDSTDIRIRRYRSRTEARESSGAFQSGCRSRVGADAEFAKRHQTFRASRADDFAGCIVTPGSDEGCVE